ncbi:MAG: hypothetical protein AMJ81_02020 [Phycisphaerae bacterium SM23_33]|nr:MAG: hypothetical protein AMJ81_02020 [Phycisphaerae bacterium SM23_33]
MAEAVDAFVAVGSNIEPDKNLPEALRLLGRCVRITGVSTVYRTAALSGQGQEEFANGVWRIRTSRLGEVVRPGAERELEPVAELTQRLRRSLQR